MSNSIFKNYGGSYQLDIQTPDDLKKILDLDEALWAATSIPVEILNADEKFLFCLDTDKNGRIRTDEIKAAVKWLFETLKNHSHIGESGDVLFLEDINTGNPEGRMLGETARLVLSNLDIENSGSITLPQVRNIQAIMASSATNGDGVITPEDTDEPELSGLISLIMKTIGTAADASGKKGISVGQINEFFSEAALHLEWLEKGRIPAGKNVTDIMVWGPEKTPKAFEIINGIEKKIDEFFALCAMCRFDSRIKDALKLNPKELEEISLGDTNSIIERLEKAPVAEINDEGILDFSGQINRSYEKQLKRLKEEVLARIYGNDMKELSLKEWENVKNIFSSYRTYLEEKKGVKAENLPEEKLKEYAGSGFKERLNALIQKDLAAAEKVKNIGVLEKLILYQKHLMEFANNSASFANVYNPEIRSLFEAGTLVIDGRKTTLAINTMDRAMHKKIAENSNVYLLYVEVTGKNGADSKFEIVAAVTSGDSGSLRIGKRGIFFTRDGKEWDARVVDIAENPIGLLESIKVPFVKLADSIKNQVERFAKSREAKIETAVISPTGSSMARDLMVGGGVAIAAIGSSFAYITRALSQVRIVHVLTTIGLILLAILLPSLIMGIIKLRRRNLSILFEASGCAINVRMKFTVSLGRIFTFVPPFPPGSHKKKLDILPRFVKESRLARNVPAHVLWAILLAYLVLAALYLTRS